MIASLTITYPPDHDRFLLLKITLGAGALALALFVILAVSCVIQGALAGRATRRRGKR